MILSNDELQATVDAYEENGRNQTRAAAALGIQRSTLQSRLRRAGERGMFGTKPVIPGFRISKTTAVTDKNGDVVREFVQQRPELGEAFQMPTGHAIKGVSALVDAYGNTVQQWIKTREEAFDPEVFVEWLKESLKGYEPAAPSIVPPQYVNNDLLTLVPLADWHVGMYAWAKEAEHNWDLHIAERVIGSGVDDLLSRTSPSGTCVILGGGDLLHSDSNLNQTAKSKNVLQVDGRYQKVVMTANRLVVRTIDRALERHTKVIVRVLPGNHDEHASVAVAYFLMAWYRNDPRVEVDVDPSLFWWFRFGRVLLGATHGHTVKIREMPSIMAHRRAEDWGQTKFRYVHGFHLHHKELLATEGNGVISEIHQAPIPQDAWHFGAGFLSGRSLQAITYHREYGEKGRVREAIMDADIAAATKVAA